MMRRGYIDCQFGQLHVSYTSEWADARPILLLNSRSRSLWKLVPILSPSFRPVIVEIPGLGLSSSPPQGASMYDVANCIVAVLDAFELQRSDAFGFYTGHKVLAALGEAHPDRVNRLILGGKTHSLIPKMEQRNTAMKAYLADAPVDAAIVQMEGRYLDDPTREQGFQRIFEANYNFDFAGALSRLEAETLIIEVTSEKENDRFGRQGPSLVELMKRGKTVDIPEVDQTGLDMYIGVEAMAGHISEFLGKAEENS